MSSDCTPAQQVYLSFIYYFTEQNKRPPTEKEVQRFLGVPLATVRRMMNTLEKRGFVTRESPRRPDPTLN